MAPAFNIFRSGDKRECRSSEGLGPQPHRPCDRHRLYCVRDRGLRIRADVGPRDPATEAVTSEGSKLAGAQERAQGRVGGQAPPKQDRSRRLEALRAIGRRENGHWVYPGPETVALIHGWGERGVFTWTPGEDSGIIVRDQGEG